MCNILFKSKLFLDDYSDSEANYGGGSLKLLQLNLNESCVNPLRSSEQLRNLHSTLRFINNLLTRPFYSISLLSLFPNIGPNVKIAIAILNCILARQLCFEDPSCSAILEIIPRVCGPVPGKFHVILRIIICGNIHDDKLLSDRNDFARTTNL